MFVTPALALSDDRLLVQVVRGTGGPDLQREAGRHGRAGVHAGRRGAAVRLTSPDGKRVAFHLASPQGYQVWTSDDGGNRVKVAAHPDHLYFGTSWSPDGQWILYVDCLYKQDPGHDWCDVCIGRPDGSEHRVLTEGQAMWFAATYGSPENRGGGSNLPAWTRDGRILFPRRLLDRKCRGSSRRSGRTSTTSTGTTSRNRRGAERKSAGWTPQRQGRGLTPASRRWDFRATESPDGKQIAFCRAATGEPPDCGSWRQPRRRQGDGCFPRDDDRGADHPRWLPAGR